VRVMRCKIGSDAKRSLLLVLRGMLECCGTCVALYLMCLSYPLILKPSEIKYEKDIAKRFYFD
jgi:hypothetical protein